MKKCIKYYNILDKIELEYSDDSLIQCIQTLSSTLENFTHIHMFFAEVEENVGCVYLVISNGSDIRLNNQEVIRLHEIDLTEESFSNCVSECQREKQLIQKHFSHVKVSSNFR